MSNCLVAFISDHGFGHAARSCAILKSLMKQGVEILIISSVPRWFFEDKFTDTPCNWTLLEEQVDVGLFQLNALKSDLSKTADALDDFWGKLDLKISKIMAFVTQKRPTLAYLDIPALGLMVAKRLNIPTVALANFSWDWIYQDQICHNSTNLNSQNLQTLEKSIEIHQKLYGKVDKLLQLPYPGDFSAFRNAEICPINWVGETNNSSRTQILSKLKLDPLKKFILLSFGGHELPEFSLDDWPKNCELQPLIITTDSKMNPNFTRSNQELALKGITYADVIAAATVIVSKPGYGIVTDCIFNQIPMIHTPRGRFAEYPTLLQALDENLNHALIQTKELSATNLIKVATDLINQKPKSIKIPLNGVQQAVQAINKMF